MEERILRLTPPSQSPNHRSLQIRWTAACGHSEEGGTMINDVSSLVFVALGLPGVLIATRIGHLAETS
jgi:hypothetical protein